MSSGNFKINDKRRWYREEYLRSDHWSDLKARKLRKNPTCEKCGSSNHVEPHHLRYRNVLDVKLSDLVSLCRKCHKAEHERLDSHKSEKTERKLVAARKKSRHHAASESLGRPPRFPVMRDKNGLPVATVLILAKKNAALLRLLCQYLGATADDIVGRAVPHSVLDAIGEHCR